MPHPGLDITPATNAPRPVEDSYWVAPGRLLAGAYPGARSRAQALERVRRLVDAGVSCFVDLTEPGELPGYDTLLPFETAGRRVLYVREPIRDHDVPAQRATMQSVLEQIDAALGDGHVVYLHCRAGIGRSATVAGCWLATRLGSGERALETLAQAWLQAAQSRLWPRVPETEAQEQYVLDWLAAAPPPRRPSRQPLARQAAWPATTLEQRLRGAWHGLALGDALGVARLAHEDASDVPLAWSQHTALALCTVASLLDAGRLDVRDQVERFLRWQREGDCTSTGAPEEHVATPDVARALATYLWRGLPAAGPHDPSDRAATSLPRVLAAASFACADPPRAVALAAECSRVTHQSPTILDACRWYGAMLVVALRGVPVAEWLEHLPDTTPSCWQGKALQADVRAAAEGSGKAPSRSAGVVHALAKVRTVIAQQRDFEAALQAAWRAGGEQATLYGALAGTLYGVAHGVDALPGGARARLAGAAQIEAVAQRCLGQAAAQGLAT